MKKQFRDFESAREFARSLGLKNWKEWNKYCKLKSRPDDLPTHPERNYKNEKLWKGMGDFLGIKMIADQNKQYRSFIDARTFVRSLELKNTLEWKTYCKSGNKPDDIPANPHQTFVNKGWNGIPDWLGNGNLSNMGRKYVSYEECQKFMQKLGITKQKEWEMYQKLNKKPINIPSHPNRNYKEQWNGWGVFFGTGRVANQNKQYRSFIDAKEFVRSLKLKSKEEWKEYCLSGNKPEDIPSAPWAVYKEWKK